MPAIKEQETINNFRDFLREWDNGNKASRSRILITFISLHQGKSGPELEKEFAQGASLFLARLTTWLRLSYMFETCLNEILQSISIFLSASNSDRYKVEFVEVGGILTLLEILGLKNLEENIKIAALKLLQILVNAGRQYKELVCESYGVRAVAKCLASSRVEETQEQAKVLLEMLAHGNPKYHNQVYRGLIAVLPCGSPKAQQLALHAIRVIQTVVGTTYHSVVDSLLGVLQSMHLEVQDEALQLIKELMKTDVRPALLKGLVALLLPSEKEYKTSRPQILDDVSVHQISGSLPSFVQQAAAVKAIGYIFKFMKLYRFILRDEWNNLKCIYDQIHGNLLPREYEPSRILSQESTELCEELIKLRVVHHLLFVLGNRDHTESQRQASLVLKYYVLTFPIVKEQVRKAIGENLFMMLMDNADSLYMKIDCVQADLLTSNQINIP